MEHFLKRTWAEIDLDAVVHNYSQIRKIVNPKSKIMCVIKADAYGHGANFLAREYEEIGADQFGVSNLEEAMQIRKAGITKPILILGYTPSCMVRELYGFNVTQTVFSREYADELAKAARDAGVVINVHVKVDTGMSRIGFMFQSPENDLKSIDEIEMVCRKKELYVEGIYTHFSSSDERTSAGQAYTHKQFDTFKLLIEKLKERGIVIPICHCCNSGGVLSYPEMSLDMVRVGIILYGLLPDAHLHNTIKLKPAMNLRTIISHIKTVKPHTSVSYGRTFISERETMLATVPIGYADGYSRALSGKSYMLVNGHKANVVGRVCMDQLMLDVTGLPGVKPGDIVTVFGDDKGAQLCINELAELEGTINYELLCLVGKRVPRIYIKNGKPIGQLNYIV